MPSSLPLSPLQRYLQDLEKENFVEDAAQKMAVDKLQNLYERLIIDQKAREKNASGWLRKFSNKKPSKKFNGKPNTAITYSKVIRMYKSIAKPNSLNTSLLKDKRNNSPNLLFSFWTSLFAVVKAKK